MEHEKFWHWFAQNCDDLKPNEITVILEEELDSWVKRLGVPAWEIGPYNEHMPLDFFALSPSGNQEVFELTKSIVGEAPSLEGWVFLAANPPKKKWNRKFFWSDAKIPIDSNEWNFLVYKYDDGLSDIVLIDDILPNLNLTKKMQVIEFAVASEIGEIGMLNSVYAIDVDTSVDRAARKSSVKLCDLKSILS